jgi:hypothetical protein
MGVTASSALGQALNSEMMRPAACVAFFPSAIACALATAEAHL